MLFNIENDSGERVIGYIVPETFSEVPDLDFIAGGHVVFSTPANEVRSALVDAGRHETGQCGFNIGCEHIPDLPRLTDLTVVEKQSRVTIYRRPYQGQINRKIVRFETGLYPLWRIDNTIGKEFQYFEKSLERHGRETVMQMFHLSHYDSIYLSGRIFFRNYASYIAEGFDCVCLLQDPYEDLVERLMVLNKVAEIGAQYLGTRDASRLAPAIAFAKTLDFEDARGLRKLLIDMPIDVAHLLSNPLVRQFTTTTPDELPAKDATARTLDVFSSFMTVGLRNEPGSFSDMVAAHLGLNSASLSPPEAFEKVRRHGQTLRELRAVDHLIERDLEVFFQVKSAIESV